MEENDRIDNLFESEPSKENPRFGFLTRSDTYRPVQSRNQARSLIFFFFFFFEIIYLIRVSSLARQKLSLICDSSVTLVGSLINCVKPKDEVKFPQSLSISQFNKFLLKSPRIINSLF